jgi:hypothetical protein
MANAREHSASFLFEIMGPALNLKSNNDSTSIVLNGSVNLTSTSIAGTYKFVGTSCTGETGTFTLSHM